MNDVKDVTKEIDRIKGQIAVQMSQIELFKKKHANYKDSGEYKNMVAELSKLQSKIVELKTTRKIALDAKRQLRYKLFREVVAERLGQEETEKLEQEAVDRMQLYKYNLTTRTFKKKNFD